jgi:hypothetical protein
VDGRVEVERRDDACARCAYCHDALGEQAIECPACATRLHAECVARAECPTLGCGHRFASATVAPSPARWTGWGAFVAVVLPIICFVANEAGFGRDDDKLVPPWRGADFAWLDQFHTAEAQRGFYPLIAWALVAYWQARSGARNRWIRVGLMGGALVSLLFSASYLRVPLLIMSMIAVIFFGVGLLGLAPHLALIEYVRAWRRYRACADPKAEEGSMLAPLMLWSALGVVAVADAVRQMDRLHAALPDHDPTCFVASAAARSPIAGATPVRFGARVVPVSRQLRTLKLFELALIALTPRLHRAIRSIYDVLGPPLATRLGPVTATLAFVALLPAQACAWLALRALLRDADGAIDDTYPRA